MVTPAQIIAQLQECLPKYTDLFHEAVVVSSASVTSNVLTLTVLAGHGVKAGNQVLVSTALIRNLITAVSLTADDTLRFTTQDDHDLTAYMSARTGRDWPDGATVTIEDLQTYTLDPTAAGVPANNMFETIPGYGLPILSGNEYLLENRALGAKGFQTVDSVTATTIIVTLTDVPDVPDGSIIITEILTNLRVSMAIDETRAQEIYTTQGAGNAWCFVIMTDREVSKSRENTDDLPSLPGSSLALINIQQTFSLLIFLPTSETLTPTYAQTLVYGSLFTDLLSCLYRWEGIGYTGDGAASYNTAYYAHSYDWFVRDQIEYTDGHENTNTVAFRILDLTQTVFDEGDFNVEIVL